MQLGSEKQTLKPGSLLLYKNRPGRLAQVGERLEIELPNGETARVRPKDVDVLHPGPLGSLSDLRPVTGEVQAAWEILAGERTNLAELAELVYGAFTPATAWAAWQQVSEGIYFEGSPANIRARSAEEVARRQQERSQAESHQRARAEFLGRARRGETIPADREFLREIETLALGRAERSPLLRELGRAETAESAHALLLELGIWDEMTNPYPARLGLPLKQPELPVPALPAEERRDLTHLAAFAIDDEDTDTPDDAVSYEEQPGGAARLWVHIADVAALVEPDSPLDLEARARGESLHLPEGTIHLLPREVTLRLGLGLNETNPALSFGMDIDTEGRVTGMEITPSRVRVTRLSYDAAEQMMDAPPLSQLERLTRRARERRRASGAVMIDFPEVRIDIADGLVRIRPLPPLRSRRMVEEAMILAGLETARFAVERGLRLPFSQQEPPDDPASRPPGETQDHPGDEPADRPADEPAGSPQTLAQMFATRRKLKRSRYTASPGPHSGLGAAAYTQITSPLRRYLDLVGHQQIRAYLKGAPLFDEGALLERIGAAEAVVGSVRQAELLSEKHWTLVYLLQHPDWRGEGVLVDTRTQHGRGAAGTVLIPALALETRVHLKREIPLDGIVSLALNGVVLPQGEASFRVE